MIFNRAHFYEQTAVWKVIKDSPEKDAALFRVFSWVSVWSQTSWFSTPYKICPITCSPPKSENRCHHCSLFWVLFSVLSFKNYYFSPLKGSTHWCLCWIISTYFKQSISFLLSKEMQLVLFSATLYAMWPLHCNSLGEFNLILQTGETLPDSRLLLQMIYVYS